MEGQRKKGFSGIEFYLFILITLINSKLRLKNGKLNCVFVNLKSTFDGMDHTLLCKKLDFMGGFFQTDSNYKNANIILNIIGDLSEQIDVST